VERDDGNGMNLAYFGGEALGIGKSASLVKQGSQEGG
jgi:hypothetical protein